MVRLRFRQSSMQHTDPARQQAQDAIDAIPPAALTAPDAIGFTELKGGPYGHVRDRCRETGYRLLHQSSVGIAVHPQHQLIDKSVTECLPGLRSPSGRGSYTDRPILEVTFETPDGYRVTLHIAHWITDAPTRTRVEKRHLQSAVMADRVAFHGRGGRLSFWMGDTNEDEGSRWEGEVQRPLTRAGLVSIYDDLHQYPSTHGRRTIDVIGRYARDGRVHPESVRVGPRRHSDHRQVDAVYQVGT
jgi:hypothetical protein